MFAKSRVVYPLFLTSCMYKVVTIEVQEYTMDHEHSPDAVARKLRDYWLSGFYADGHKYIQGLSSSNRQHTLVAIEAALLYILQGQYNYAADATYEGLGAGSVAIDGTQSEENIFLGIIQAFVALMRESKLQTALRLADVALEILPPIGSSIRSHHFTDGSAKSTPRYRRAESNPKRMAERDRHI